MLLEGVKVLEVCQFMSGPYCGMLLADHGAEVIKIERAGEGDETRRQGPPFINGVGIYFMSVNRNKKSVALNLKSAEGINAFKRLAKDADVVMENMRTGVMERLGLGYEAIKKVNPSIIYCSVTGFGHYGPYAERGGYDQIIQGMSGLMSITGEKDGAPVKVGIPITDICASMFAFGSINMALYNRTKTKEGSFIDISMLDCAVSWLTFQAGRHLATGEIPERMGSSHPLVVPYKAYKCKDEYLNIGGANDQNFARICRVLERTDLIKDTRFKSNPDRVKNRKELDAIIEHELSRKTRDQWLEEFMAAGLPCGPINNIKDVFEDPHIIARGMLEEVEHPVVGSYKTFGKAIKVENEAKKKFIYAPSLGEHTEEVLGKLGYTPEEIKKTQ